MKVYVLTMSISDNKSLDLPEYRYGDDRIIFDRYIGTYNSIEAAAEVASSRIDCIIAAATSFEKYILGGDEQRFWDDCVDSSVRTKHLISIFEKRGMYVFDVDGRLYDYQFRFKLCEENV